MSSDIYRREAVEHRGGSRRESDVLLVSPAWPTWTLRLVLVLAGASAALIGSVSVSRYADGPAIVRAEADAASDPARPIAAIDRAERFAVMAFLPGDRGPAVRPGQPARVEIAGYPFNYRDLTIDRVEPALMSAAEIQQRFGSGVPLSRATGAPFVVVHAVIPDTTFLVGGERHRYMDGLGGTLRVRIGSERLLTLLLPRLGPAASAR